MWHWAMKRKRGPTNSADQDSDQISRRCLSIIFVVLLLMNSASIFYGTIQSPDGMKALPYILIHHTFVTLFYAVAYSILVRTGFFTSLYFLVAYHVLLGTITLMHTYLFWLVKAVAKGVPYFPGWLHLASAKSLANFSNWYAVHLVFLLSAVVVSQLTSKK